MNWKYNAPGSAATAAAPATQAAPVGHPLPPPTSAPAALPQMQQPPAPTPAAGEPTKAPRKRRGAAEIAAANAATAAAAQPATAAAVPAQSWQPQPAPAAVITAPAIANPAPTVLQGGFLSLFTPTDPTKTAAAAIKRIAELKGGQPNDFPTIGLTGGDTGGMFDYDEMNEEGSDDDLPTGRTSFVGVLIAYRILCIAWPRGASGPGGPKTTPKWQSVISANEGAAAEVAAAAFKRYSFRTTRPEQKGAAEPFYDSLCHPSMAVEALIFEPEAGLMCVRSCWTHDSLAFTNDQIIAAFPNGTMSPAPVQVEPHTWTTAGSKKRPTGWTAHGIKFNLPPAQGVPPEVTAAVQAFSAFYAQAGNNPDLIEALHDWCKHSLTADQLATLQQIANGA